MFLFNNIFWVIPTPYRFTAYILSLEKKGNYRLGMNNLNTSKLGGV